MKTPPITSNNSRRNFLKSSALVAAGSLGSATTVLANNSIQSTENQVVESKNKNIITILITSDIHGQLHTHDEFFWENNQAVYRKRGGLAVLKTMINSLKKQNPQNTIVYDGGDYFHGHAVASLTEGEALIPLFNNLAYDLMLPGNWEVVYKKKKMLYDMGHANAAKICANMWHKTDDADNGELVYQPYWIKYLAGIKVGFIGYTTNNSNVVILDKNGNRLDDIDIEFSVDKQGNAYNVKVITDIDSTNAKTLADIVKDGPKWITTKKKNKARISLKIP